MIVSRVTRVSNCAQQTSPLEWSFVTRNERQSRGIQRIVSLAPSVTSTLFALGLEKRLAGVTKWCADVAPVRNLPRLGDCWSADADEVARLKPDLVIGSVPYKQEVVGALLERGLTLLALRPATLADVQRDILLLGRLLGAARQAQTVVRAMRKRIAAVRKQASRARTRPRVYCESWSNPLMVSPRWVEESVGIAGGEFVPAGGGRKVTKEEVIAADPEIIVLAWCATGDRAEPAQVLRRQGWERITAVREKQIVVIRDEMLNTPSPILLDGLEALARLIHPELFAETTKAGDSQSGREATRRKAIGHADHRPAQPAAN